tara:strand:+ start:323 stop:571 length:249 start_codon:yes stop_codon:yes gene_type:complete
MNEIKKSIKSIVKKVMSEADEDQVLVQPIDHSKAVGSDAVTDEQEVIDHSTGKVVKISDRTVSLSEQRLRSIVSSILRRTNR